MAQQHNDNIPYYEIFSIREYVREGETKSSWLRIGAGFKNRDDSFGLVFQAMPLPDPKSGLLRLYMRPFRPETEQDAAQGKDAFYLEIDPLMGAPLEELVMKHPANVVSLSGGKDSTAMLLMLLEHGEPVADVAFFDTGCEFPEMYEHLEKLEAFTGLKITRLRPRLPVGTDTEKSPFDWMFSEYPVVRRGTRQVHMVGRGWPAASRRWCTGRKQQALKAHLLALTHRSGLELPLRQCVGFAADELHRLDGVTKRNSAWCIQRYPLVEWGVTEADALDYCYKRGFTWGGLYHFFSRVSCFCCPLQSLNDLRTLRGYFPDLWQRMLTMESWLPEGKARRFKDSGVSTLDARFAAEETE